jgi:hypothetical protein
MCSWFVVGTQVPSLRTCVRRTSGLVLGEKAVLLARLAMLCYNRGCRACSLRTSVGRFFAAALQYLAQAAERAHYERALVVRTQVRQL